MNLEPRQREDYGGRQIEAARRVLVDLGQVLRGRDKPKDAYDFCFFLDHYPGGLKELAANWKKRAAEKDVAKALEILEEKFSTVESYGPAQVVEFHASASGEEQERQARRAFEQVQEFLRQVQ
jgi:hypothetical protein